MTPTLTEEQEHVRASAREVLRAECTLDRVRAMAGDDRGYDPDLWRAMAELGWHALALPAEHGGLGLGFVELGLILEEQGRHLLPGPFVPTVVLAGQALAAFGTRSQQRRLLPGIASGELVVAAALHGAGCGWGVEAVQIDARASGEDLVLDGIADLVPYAHVADLFLVLARVEGEPVAAMVPRGADGVDIAPQPTVGGDHRSRVRFAGCHVPASAILGGVEVSDRIATWGAMACCAEMLGAAERMLEMTVSYATERTAFGRPIGSFQAIQHHCADLAVDVLAARGVTREAMWRVAHDDHASRSVSVAKAWSSDAMARAAARAHQVHGAIGFTEEHDLHLFTRYLRTRELDFGDGTWHRAHLVRDAGLAG